MMRLVLFFSVLLFYSGCALVNSNSSINEVNISKRVYKEISKDAILEATKKMFIVSNKNLKSNEFVIDSYRNKVEISRVTYSNLFLDTELYLDKLIIEVYQFENETRVNLLIIRTDAIEQVKSLEIPIQAYEQYWFQLNYLLGLNQKWVDCDTNKYEGVFFETNLCNEFFYHSKLFVSKPKEDDKIKDIYFFKKERKNYTIDKIKTNIFENPSLDDTKVNEGLYTDSEKVEDIKIKNVVLEEQIFETKEEKVEVAAESQTEEVAETKEKIDSKNSGDEKIKEEDINAFTKNINNIINKKKQ